MERNNFSFNSLLSDQDPSLVLIVDHPDNQLVMIPAIEMLEDSGYKTHYVTNRETALKTLIDNPQKYCAVIMKSHLEVDRDDSLLSEIKSSPILKNIPVIIASPNADENSYLNALSRGAYELLFIPIDAELLNYVITSAVQAKNIDSEDSVVSPFCS